MVWYGKLFVVKWKATSATNDIVATFRSPGTLLSSYKYRDSIYRPLVRCSFNTRGSSIVVIVIIHQDPLNSHQDPGEGGGQRYLPLRDGKFKSLYLHRYIRQVLW